MLFWKTRVFIGTMTKRLLILKMEDNQTFVPKTEIRIASVQG